MHPPDFIVPPLTVLHVGRPRRLLAVLVDEGEYTTECTVNAFVKGEFSDVEGCRGEGCISSAACLLQYKP
jgi:hypothetical protein